MLNKETELLLLCDQDAVLTPELTPQLLIYDIMAAAKSVTYIDLCLMRLFLRDGIIARPDDMLPELKQKYLLELLLQAIKKENVDVVRLLLRYGGAADVCQECVVNNILQEAFTTAITICNSFIVNM